MRGRSDPRQGMSVRSQPLSPRRRKPDVAASAPSETQAELPAVNGASTTPTTASPATSRHPFSCNHAILGITLAILAIALRHQASSTTRASVTSEEPTLKESESIFSEASRNVFVLHGRTAQAEASLTAAVSSREPILWRSSFASDWPALHRWDFRRMQERLPWVMARKQLSAEFVLTAPQRGGSAPLLQGAPSWEPLSPALSNVSVTTILNARARSSDGEIAVANPRPNCSERAPDGS